MIMYHAITNYHILKCILHKIFYHSEKKAVLYISNIHMDKYNLQNKILASKIFSDVKIFNEFPIELYSNEKRSSNHIIKKILESVKENQINFKEMEEINVCGDHYTLGLYLVMNKIGYNFFEEASGFLSNPSVLENNVKSLNMFHYHLMMKYHLQGNNNQVKKRFGELNNQKEGYYNEKDCDFPITEILKKIKKQDIDKIIDIFGSVKIDTNETNLALLLTQHLINLKRSTFNEQKLLYTLLADYFCFDKKIIIKPHPSDFHAHYDEWLPGATILGRNLPSELISFCYNKKFDLGITAYSTAIYGIKDCLNSTFCFEESFQNSYVKIHLYYITMLVLKRILIKKDNKIYSIGTNDDILINLAKKYQISLPTIEKIQKTSQIEADEKQRKIILIDENISSYHNPQELFKDLKQTISVDDIIIYINSDKKAYFYNGYDRSLFDQITTIKIEKRSINNAVDTELLKPDYLYIYTQSKKVREEINVMKETKKLKNTGISIEVNQQEQMEIKRLEGILRATEARLLEETKIADKLRQDMKKTLSWKKKQLLLYIRSRIEKMKKGLKRILPLKIQNIIRKILRR